MHGSAGVSKALSLLMGANVKVRRFGIGLQEEEMGHQMKNIGRSKKGMIYDSVLGSDDCILLLLRPQRRGREAKVVACSG